MKRNLGLSLHQAFSLAQGLEEMIFCLIIWRYLRFVVGVFADNEPVFWNNLYDPGITGAILGDIRTIKDSLVRT